MRRWLDPVHRWAGALVGLAIAAAGLSGVLLLWQRWWLPLPGVRDVPGLNTSAIAALVDKADAMGARNIVLPSADFGLARVALGDGAGAYLAADATVVASWRSPLERPETWLFELHHSLLMGETGTVLTGLFGLLGLAFVVTGVILWWPLRRKLKLQLLPSRMTRPAIVRHHRNLGVLATPLLVVTMLTGSMMALKPVAAFLLGPLSAASEVAAFKRETPFVMAAGPRAPWLELVTSGGMAFPDASLRIVSFPKNAQNPITMRYRQPAEWHSNGRSQVRLDPVRGAVLDKRDALAAPRALQADYKVYPLHAGRVGGLAWRLALSFAGLALFMLGSFTVWSFWQRRFTTLAPRAVTG